MNERIATETGDETKRSSLRRRRLELDLTQEEMAKRMGVSRSTYSELETGRYLTKTMARKIAEQTGKSVGEVWDEYERLQGIV